MLRLIILPNVIQSTTIDRKSAHLLRHCEKCQKKRQVLRVQILLMMKHSQIRFGWIKLLGGPFRWLISSLERWKFDFYFINFWPKYFNQQSCHIFNLLSQLWICWSLWWCQNIQAHSNMKIKKVFVFWYYQNIIPKYTTEILISKIKVLDSTVNDFLFSISWDKSTVQL